MAPIRSKFAAPTDRKITQISSLHALRENGRSLRNCTLQGLDLTGETLDWDEMTIDHTLFLGCRLPAEAEAKLLRRGAYIYRAPEALPYRPFRTELYHWQELMDVPGERSLDHRIYQHFSATRYRPSINEALWQRVHDHAMDDALRRLLEFDANGMTQRRSVAIMGGHGVARTQADYRKTAQAAKLLGEAGYFVVSGGGPGIMEAANLGAYLAGRPDDALEKSLEILAPAPGYQDPGYHERAMRVLDAYPDGRESLAIPTWFYGHEPSNLFASHIAKYFSNSIREDTLLAVALYGIIFAPGSAGTTQEIFMDAAQNHYGTYNYFSPMIFLGRQRYEIDTLLFPVLRQLSHGREYHDLLFLTDEPREVVDFLAKNPPIEK